MHQCKACSLVLPVESFRVHKKGYRIGKCRPCESAYQRDYYARGGELTRQRKRVQMAAARAAYHAKNKEKVNALRRDEHKTRLFWVRALRYRGITARQLASLWRKQRGLCALTGAKIGRDAELDHKTPRARGGANDLSNLQWVTPVANRAKRDLTDAEFLALCQSCVRWVGAGVG